MPSSNHQLLAPTPSLPSAFRPWRAQVLRTGVLPVIAVIGSRGKSTVVHLLDHVFRSAGLTTATRTDAGVDILGVRQHGEIAPWSRALEQLSSNGLDIAIEEIDWASLHALGIQPRSHPVVALLNVCANRESCLIQDDARRAVAVLPSVFAAVSGGGALVLNGDDHTIAGDDLYHECETIVVGESAANPVLHLHLESGGASAWMDGGRLQVGVLGHAGSVGDVRDLPFTLRGKAGFQNQNALIAGACAAACGIPLERVASALATFSPKPSTLPASFRALSMDGSTVLIDRPCPSWFLRPLLRTLRDLAPAKTTIVVGRLSGVPEGDLAETGRLLGRAANILIFHSIVKSDERSKLLRAGAASNSVTPILVHTTDEERAVAKALGHTRPGEAVLILADDMDTVMSAIEQNADVSRRPHREPVSAV